MLFALRPLAAQIIEHPKILLINSYNPEYAWTEDQYDGIMDKLEDLGREYLVFTEYLDWKRNPTENNLRLMYELCKSKYREQKIDLIITTDDAALRFAIAHRDELFSSAPIVFAGVYRDEALQITKGQARVTGAYQNMDIDATIRCALKINPRTDRAYILNEDTESGRQTEGLTREALARVLPKVPVFSLSDRSLDEIAAMVQMLDRNSLFIMGSYSIEKNGQPLTIERLAARISAESSVPVYPLFTHSFGSGAIGGVMISGRRHGENAGDIAVRYLNGEPFRFLAPATDGNTVTEFDYKAFQRFGIPAWAAPKGAHFINRDDPFFVRYKTESLFMLAIFVLLVGAVQLLLLLNRQARVLALTDQLTKLPNRAAILRVAERTIRSTERWNKCGVMYIDIDNFKYINDTFGHETGDKVLLHVSETLGSLIAENMRLSRFGGDEFLIIVENSSYDKIEAFAQYVHATFTRKATIAGQEIFLTISTGISVYPDHGLHFSELYKNADVAMFKAKSAGKTRFVFYNESMFQELRRRMELATALHSAIANGELSVMYQPQINLATGFIDGIEALLRWNHPREGPIPPAEFIPIAEDTGQIAEIGLFVIRSVAQLLKKAKDTGIEGLTVSVNVSVKQLTTDGFLKTLLEIVRGEGVEPKSLSLEITESILLESVEEIRKTLQAIRDAGFPLLLDDFGKGYSSLTYLRRLPVNVIKMDKAFVDDMFEDERSRAFMVAIIRTCHDLSLKVVAEGVETREQVQFLGEIGCDYIQGYYFSKPERMERIASLLGRCYLITAGT
jgi:diguanylate cyclase (GGDEF)-like protein